MNNSIIDKAKSFARETFQSKVHPKYTYHNFDHTSKVVRAIGQLCNKGKMDAEQEEILTLAAYFHDIGFSIDPENHENHSKQIAKKNLLEWGYNIEKIQKVLDCIEATKMDWKGEDKMCQFIKDADLSGLSDPNYIETAENLRKEMVNRTNKEITKQDWIKTNIDFLQNHYYCTEEGKELFQDGKLKNLSKLKSLEEEKKKKKEKKLLTIGSSKNAQTQFKTALRNHIDLSSIADNKANIMLSVNAVIITVGLPLLIDRVYDFPDLKIPTIILAIVSLISMIFERFFNLPS